MADAFDAMISDRVYRVGRTFAEAANELKRQAGQQFDPEVIECFARIPKREWELAQETSLQASVVRHDYIREHGEDMPEIANWKWA